MALGLPDLWQTQYRVVQEQIVLYRTATAHLKLDLKFTRIEFDKNSVDRFVAIKMLSEDLLAAVPLEPNRLGVPRTWPCRNQACQIF